MSLPKIHEKFSESTQSTIAFVSCDGTTFHVERAKLERAADFMPPSSEVPSSPTEPVALSEDAATLELLFRFAYCEVHIDLDTVRFETAAALAEAAEKYLVYSAMAVCHAHMKGQAKKHPVEVMRYAAKYNHRDILDVVAPYTIGTSFRTMQEILPVPMLVAWGVFNDQYQQELQRMLRITWHADYRDIRHFTDDDVENYCMGGCQGPEPGEPCGLGDQRESTWLDINEKIMSTLHSIQDAPSRLVHSHDAVVTYDTLRRVRGCDYCTEYLESLRDEFARCKVKTCGTFTSFL
ncbi:hypothetical protein BD626DRAFT_439025 [Schizophyllum amplum]|uniref:BTB domain-containing protein n=1 Tax=Schizophyllum amplum TaxID=97359 RepID=A0A550BZ39_9AGAR|nr:hypothetical protein BD626DRAFT_439025 [Auriculariopsis ampla]